MIGYTKVRTKPCPKCGETAEITCTVEEANNFINRPDLLIQNIFPNMSMGTRERFITGYCEPCWIDMLYVPDEDKTEDSMICSASDPCNYND